MSMGRLMPTRSVACEMPTRSAACEVTIVREVGETVTDRSLRIASTTRSSTS